MQSKVIDKKTLIRTIYVDPVLTFGFESSVVVNWPWSKSQADGSIFMKPGREWSVSYPKEMINLDRTPFLLVQSSRVVGQPHRHRRVNYYVNANTEQYLSPIYHGVTYSRQCHQTFHLGGQSGNHGAKRVRQWFWIVLCSSVTLYYSMRGLCLCI